MKGKAEVVISRGEVIVQGDGFLGKKGRGKNSSGEAARCCRLESQACATIDRGLLLPI